ncbi:hypothetical protein GCM10012280_30620 [Wenjunlia tyrosinilytica]|uniref:HTH tetR-type domain-containing protein n=2 Tax=Wenjunlia tyrosinilytica TaxID=1544741 RepID=A0A917ZRJ0_9ACTN|nr:hypothetical protein GCM10012280_30620 [Wenjunlia tyrosinilytica]
MEPARSPRRRAPRNSLNRELIIESALRLLDGEGVGAFTMRALAQELGVGAMALYTYFQGKEELFDAARERLLARYQPVGAEGSPREQLRESCIAVYRLFAEHPSVIELLIGRPERCDAASAGVEHMVGLLRRCGLGPADASRAQMALMQYTLGVARWAARGADRARYGGDGTERCPPGGEPQFQYGLEALLDGLVEGPRDEAARAAGAGVMDHGGSSRAVG